MCWVTEGCGEVESAKWFIRPVIDSGERESESNFYHWLSME